MRLPATSDLKLALKVPSELSLKQPVAGGVQPTNILTIAYRVYMIMIMLSSKSPLMGLN